MSRNYYRPIWNFEKRISYPNTSNQMILLVTRVPDGELGHHFATNRMMRVLGPLILAIVNVEPDLVLHPFKLYIVPEAIVNSKEITV